MINPLVGISPSPKPIPRLGVKKAQKDLLPIWASKGVSEKPGACQSCAFHTSGSGFCPSWFPDQHKTPKLGFLLDFPGSDEIIEGRPWAGKLGYSWEKKFLAPYGLSLSDVLIDHIIRCQPKERRWGKPVYPTAGLRRSAELQCRRHDNVCWGGPATRTGGLETYDPNLFVITFHPSDALLTPALGRLILKDIEKALKWADKGYRPLVLMGVEGKELVAPWLKGPVKSWRGSWWKGSWPFKSGSSMIEPELGFLSV